MYDERYHLQLIHSTPLDAARLAITGFKTGSGHGVFTEWP